MFSWVLPYTTAVSLKTPEMHSEKSFCSGLSSHYLRTSYSFSFRSCLSSSFLCFRSCDCAACAISTPFPVMAVGDVFVIFVCEEIVVDSFDMSRRSRFCCIAVCIDCTVSFLRTDLSFCAFQGYRLPIFVLSCLVRLSEGYGVRCYFSLAPILTL